MLEQYESPRFAKIETEHVIASLELPNSTPPHCGTSTSSGLTMEFFVSIAQNKWV